MNVDVDDLTYALFSLRRAAEHGYPWSVTPHEATALVEEVERLRCEVGRERAAVVAWLRGPCIDGVIEEACVLAADAIERGEHRREDEP